MMKKLTNGIAILTFFSGGISAQPEIVQQKITDQTLNLISRLREALKMNYFSVYYHTPDGMVYRWYHDVNTPRDAKAQALQFSVMQLNPAQWTEQCSRQKCLQRITLYAMNGGEECLDHLAAVIGIYLDPRGKICIVHAKSVALLRSNISNALGLIPPINLPIAPRPQVCAIFVAKAPLDQLAAVRESIEQYMNRQRTRRIVIAYLDTEGQICCWNWSSELSSAALDHALEQTLAQCLCDEWDGTPDLWMPDYLEEEKTPIHLLVAVTPSGTSARVYEDKQHTLGRLRSADTMLSLYSSLLALRKKAKPDHDTDQPPAPCECAPVP